MNTKTYKNISRVSAILIFVCGGLFFVGETPLKLFFEKDTAGGIAFLIAILLILVMILLAVITMWANKKSRVIRNDGLQYIARQLGGQYFPTGNLEILGKFAEALKAGVYNSLKGKASNLIAGKYKNKSVAVFDQTYAVNEGDSPSLYAQTFYMIEMTEANYPLFHLEPANIRFGFNEMMNRPLRQDINFASHPKFSDRYILYGQNEQQLQQFFTPEILTFFEQSPSFTTIAGGIFLIIYKHYDKSEPKEIMQTLDYLLNLGGVLLNRR
jgi:hypothetical protein